MVYTAEEAAEAVDASVEIVDLPLDHAVGQARRCSTRAQDLEGARTGTKDTRTAGFGGESPATIAEEAFEDLDAP